MKKGKQLTGWLLTLVLIMTLIAGCGGNENGGEKEIPSTGEEKASQEQVQSTPTESVNSNVEESERPTFTVATVRYNDIWPTDFYEEGMWKELEDKLNINIEWQIYTSADWSEKKSTMFISGDLPDAFFGSLGNSSADYLNNPEYFVDLTDLIPQYMPNYSKILESDPIQRYTVTETDGRIWSLGNGGSPESRESENSIASAEVPFINKVWLDNLGLDMPETYEDLANVLKAFAEQDANGNGDPTDEIPYSGFANLDNDLSYIGQAFGTVTNSGRNYLALDENKDIFFMLTSDKYKASVEWLHELWDAGCFDPESVTQDASMYYAKNQADGGCRVGLVYRWDTVTDVGQYADEFVPLPAVTGPDGNKYIKDDPYALGSNCQMAITTKCKDPGKLLQWADEFYTDDVTIQTIYGSFGVGCDKTEDGKYFIHKDPDATYFWFVSPKSFSIRYTTKKCLDSIVYEEGNSDLKKKKIDELYKEYSRDYNCVAPPLKFTDEQLEQLSDLTTEIFSYCTQMHAHWLTEGGIEDEWDEYLKHLDQAGLQDFLDIINESYDNFNEMMRNMGN